MRSVMLSSICVFASVAIASIECSSSLHKQNLAVKHHRHQRLKAGKQATPSHSRLVFASTVPAAGSQKSPDKDSVIKVDPPAGSLTLIKDYSGSSFFNGFDFFTGADPTHGNVNYVQDDTLAFVNSHGHAIVKVDNASYVNSNRNSVRIVSQDTVQEGQLLLFDILHMPTGCSTWPAAWLVGPNWPAQGEIDIVEGVNNLQANQMTLHTAAGCNLQVPMNASGQVLTTNCDAASTGNVGCGVKGADGSFGSSFNKARGGVFATYWTEDGISIWFFPRGQIPSDIKQRAPQPSSLWGQPAAFFASSACASSFFKGLQIVINTTLCGDWANAVFNTDCPGSCADFVKDPANFDQAYWDIASVRIYG